MMQHIPGLAGRFIGASALSLGLLGALEPTARPAEALTLDNGLVAAEFDGSGLRCLTDVQTQRRVRWGGDRATLILEGESLSVPGLPFQGLTRRKDRLTYRYAAGSRLVEVVYELKSGWRFVSKQLVLTLPSGGTSRVDRIEVMRAELETPVARESKASHGSGAVFLRLGGPAAAAPDGIFLALQNPFLQWERQGPQVGLAYAPEMGWRAQDGSFASDRVCVGPYTLTGTEYPSRALAEWKYVPEPARAFEGKPRLDLAETEALTRCIEAFALYTPKRSPRVHVPWCENDYQIDVATPAGRTEWKRILDQCAALGCDATLFTPANRDVAPLADNADAWGWENCLWLGLGQKIRKGEWNIATDPIPPSIQEMLDAARARRVKLVAYVYPTLGWKQNPEWTAWCGGKTGGYIGVDTGVRSFQDWLVDQLVAFQKRTGIAGYSFDHWWIAYEAKDGMQPTSKYAQWYGCRRILEALRRRLPDVVIDGRQQYQWFGAWTWLGGSYPHPTTNDEQPGSFENYPDLHFSRVSGDRQRWATWYYRMEQFTPWDLVPGYMTHQTPRNDAQGQCVRDRPFHTRDWDQLGWRYSVISSIGTAPFNHVVNLLPARDETEFAHFRPADQRWWRDWMTWTDRHRATLRHLRPIVGPPMLGRIDGTAAVVADRGFVFLFNPNYRELTAEFALDASLGLTEGDTFLLRELYPRPGRWHGAARTGVWRRGDRVQLPLKGPEALVLELVPAGKARRPLLLHARGQVALRGDRLVVSEAEGERGTRRDLGILLPAGKQVSRVSLNGRDLPSFARQEDLVTVPVQFGGAAFTHCQQVGTYAATFAGRVFRGEFTVPARVVAQLAARRQAWPVAYTAEELRATWRGSDRLLLFPQIAEPQDTWDVGLKLNGQAVEVRKAYSDVFPLGRDRTFTGFYADISHLQPETRYEVEVTLPEGLQPGQFQGLFFENVEAEFTQEILAP